MRTTLSISDDVLLAAKAMARSQGKTVGEIVSDLARKSLQRKSPKSSTTRNGIPLLPTRGRGSVVTMEIVKALRDETE